MKNLLTRKMGIELTAFTNTVSFSDDSSGAFLVETEDYFQLRCYLEKVNKRVETISQEFYGEVEKLDPEDRMDFLRLASSQEGTYPYRLEADMRKADDELVTLMDSMCTIMEKAPQYGTIIFKQDFGKPLEIDTTHMNPVAISIMVTVDDVLIDVTVVDVPEVTPEVETEEEPDRQQQQRSCIIL